jgi:DNA transformation protein
MRKDRSFHDYAVYDLLGDVPGISSRAMFGGWGIYKDGVIFGIIADGALYFKVDDRNRAYFEEAGSRPFTYEGGNRKPVALPYWLLPEEAMEGGQDLYEWVERSVEAGERGRKRPKRKT